LKSVSLLYKLSIMPPKDKNTAAEQTTPVVPVVGHEPIQAGGVTIQRPTTITTTERTLKEGKIG
jgi:hypothetical protein